MPKYKIIKAPAGRWGEGWQVGDIVDIDDEAARDAKENGEIEPYFMDIKQEQARPQVEAGKFTCSICGKGVKSVLGLKSHLRTHA